MAEQWTRDELVAAFPDGSLTVQIDDLTRPMTTDEWQAYIDAAVGTDKPEFDA